jgi:hypothetical protein
LWICRRVSGAIGYPFPSFRLWSGAMPKIFICYRHDDAAFEAAWIRDELVAYSGKFEVFLDIDTIPRGSDFRREIDKKVGECDYLIAVIGKFWLAVHDDSGQCRLDNIDDWVRLEIQSALNRNIPVIPVLLHNVAMPRREDLPKDLEEFAYRQAHSIHLVDRQHDIEKLIDDINEQEERRLGAADRSREYKARSSGAKDKHGPRPQIARSEKISAQPSSTWSLRILVSSPGDVEEERLIAERVLKRLADQFSDVVQVEPIFWEHEPLVPSWGAGHRTRRRTIRQPDSSRFGFPRAILPRSRKPTKRGWHKRPA